MEEARGLGVAVVAFAFSIDSNEECENHYSNGLQYFLN